MSTIPKRIRTNPYSMKSPRSARLWKMLVSRSGLIPIPSGNDDPPTKTVTIPIPPNHVFKVVISNKRNTRTSVPFRKRHKQLAVLRKDRIYPIHAEVYVSECRQ
jgi:hypothetical protein